MTLRLSHFYAGYGRVPVVRDISIEIGEGRIVGLLGANGAGKTTLMRAVSGLATMQGGSLEFAGRDVSGLSSADRVARGLIQVPQGRHLFGEMSVRENLEMGAYLAASEATETRMRDVFSLFPILNERERQPAAVLSGGEQQMLAVGRALMTNPRLIILDEATEGLAPLIREEIWRCLELLRKSGQSILVIDKNVDALTRIADRHYIIERGRVVWSGDSQALAGSPDVQHRYLGI